MMLRKKTKQSPMTSCLLSLLTVVGLMLACFLFCTVLFQLNQASIKTTTSALLGFFA